MSVDDLLARIDAQVTACVGPDWPDLPGLLSRIGAQVRACVDVAPPAWGSEVTKAQVLAAGPRTELTQTMTGAEALAVLRSDGHLSGALITSGMTLDPDKDAVGWVLEDFHIDAGLYGVDSHYLSASGDARPIMRYGRIEGAAARGTSGGTSATFYGGSMRLAFVDLYGGGDGVKGQDNLELYACHVHGMDHPEGAHSDAVQIRSGMGQKFSWCVLSSIADYGQPGVLGNAVLQTGGMTGNAQAQFTDCWVDGGNYTLRISTSTPPLVDYLFRRNKHGRNFQYGPILGDAKIPWSGGGDRYDDSNVWEDTGLPVLNG